MQAAFVCCVRPSVQVRKSKGVKELLIDLREVGVDWMGGTSPAQPELKGEKCSALNREVPMRAVAPSVTQLYILRAKISEIKRAVEDSKGGFLSMGGRDLTDEELEKIVSFYGRSQFFEYALDLEGTVSQCADMSHLWLREFYLEMCDVLQFPIEESLPWLLCSHILKTQSLAHYDHLFYVMDIYNDAASTTLNKLQRQFLFDEAEAEVNLCFDRLLFILGEQVYSHYKSLSAVCLIDKRYLYLLAKVLKDKSKLHLVPGRYDVMMRQRHLQRVGRSVDLNAMLRQRLHGHLRQNIENAIRQFESSDLTGIIELEQQLTVIRSTHKLIAERVELEPFSLMMLEVNDSINPASFQTRILFHVLSEMLQDVFPNFAYNNSTRRFRRAPYEFVGQENIKREKREKPRNLYQYGSQALTEAFAWIHESGHGFIGQMHLEALIRVVGSSALPWLLTESLRVVETTIVGVINPYLSQITKGFPASSKLPTFVFGVQGVYYHFDKRLQSIESYSDLKPGLMQSMREVGNFVVFSELLHSALAVVETVDCILTAPIAGHTRPIEGAAPPNLLPRMVDELIAKLGRRVNPAVAEVQPPRRPHRLPPR